MDDVHDIRLYQKMQPLLHFVRTGEIPDKLNQRSFRELRNTLKNAGKWDVYKDAFESLYQHWTRAGVIQSVNDFEQLELQALNDLDKISRSHMVQSKKFANIALYRAIGNATINPILAAKWIAEEFADEKRDELQVYDRELALWLRHNAPEMAELVDQFKRDIQVLISQYSNEIGYNANAGVKRMQMLMQDYEDAKQVFYAFAQGTPKKQNTFTSQKARELAVEFWESAVPNDIEDPGVNVVLMSILEPLLPKSIHANTDLLQFMEENYEFAANNLYFSEKIHPLLMQPESLLVYYVLIRDRKGLIKRWQKFLPLKKLEVIANAFGESVIENE